MCEKTVDFYTDEVSIALDDAYGIAFKYSIVAHL